MSRFLTATSLGLLLATVMATAQSGQSVPINESESTGLWFVELSSPPTDEGTAAATLEREETDFHAAAANARVRYSEGRHFRKLWNGLTVRASETDIAKVRTLPGVQSVSPVLTVSMQQAPEDPTAPPVADLTTAIKMTGADIAQSELGLTGRGIRVAVMDTGVDYHHPDLGGCFGPGCRVRRGYDFVGDNFNSSSADPAQLVPHPDADPDDCNGHGTHVSGIIGANGGITGVAPDVTFNAYRVFGCEGTTTSDIMLAAMEMVLDDGADVLNMSIGAALQWPQYPTAKAASQLVKHGIVVVASIGNEGTLGLYAASAPGVGKDVIGVASFDNTFANLDSFTVSPDNTSVGYAAADGAPAPPKTGSSPMARTGTATATADACAALPAGSLSGTVALIRRGTCSFYQKAFNAQTAGAIGVVLYNNAAGFISPTVVGTPPITIPVVSISAAKGVLIDARLAAGPVTMTWTSNVSSEPQSTGGLISSFSSYGLPADLSFKPDLGAPGGAVRSTLPLEQGGYGNLSGTSMASPHVAGAVALFLEAHPHARPKEIEQRLQNTARPAMWWGNPTLGFLDNVHRQGAGLLRIDDAIEANVSVSPGSLALGEVETGSVVKRLRVEFNEREDGFWNKRKHHGGHDDDAVTYTLGHVPALSTGANTFVPSFFAGFATVTFSRPTITIGGHRGHHDDGADFLVTITPPADSSTRLFGGYITLTPDDGSAVLRVPYGGYSGDYQAIVALTPTPANFPWLAKLQGASLFNQPNGATFTLAGDDLPYVLLHLDHQVRTLKMEVFDQATGESVGFADIEQFLPRNTTATSFFAFTWDGTVMKKQGGKLRAVPDGLYRLDLSVLKALGDPRNPAHTEHWLSPDILIDRP
jgi:subtilisin family serine protease